MKNLLIIMMSLVVLACSQSSAPPAQETVETDLGSGVVLFNFTEGQAITSPLELSGVVPRSWFFEGIVPIVILTLEEKLVVEGNGYGDWLVPNSDGKIEAGDLIVFTSTLDFSLPTESGIGKIRIFQDSTGSDESGIEPEYVETMIRW